MSWDEERAGRALGAGLMRVDPPASRVELERIVRDGRRGERRTRVASAVGAALVVAVGLPVAVLVVRDLGATRTDDPWSTAEVHVGTATPANCTVSELDRPGQQTQTTLEVADPTGTILFGSSGNHLVRWRNGSVEINPVAVEKRLGGIFAGLDPRDLLPRQGRGLIPNRFHALREHIKTVTTDQLSEPAIANAAGRDLRPQVPHTGIGKADIIGD